MPSLLLSALGIIPRVPSYVTRALLYCDTQRVDLSASWSDDTRSALGRSDDKGCYGLLVHLGGVGDTAKTPIVAILSPLDNPSESVLCIYAPWQLVSISMRRLDDYMHVHEVI